MSNLHSLLLIEIYNVSCIIHVMGSGGCDVTVSEAFPHFDDLCLASRLLPQTSTHASLTVYGECLLMSCITNILKELVTYPNTATSYYILVLQKGILSSARHFISKIEKV